MCKSDPSRNSWPHRRLSPLSSNSLRPSPNIEVFHRNLRSDRPPLAEKSQLAPFLLMFLLEECQVHDFTQILRPRDNLPSSLSGPFQSRLTFSLSLDYRQSVKKFLASPGKHAFSTIRSNCFSLCFFGFELLIFLIYSCLSSSCLDESDHYGRLSPLSSSNSLRTSPNIEVFHRNLHSDRPPLAEKSQLAPFPLMVLLEECQVHDFTQLVIHLERPDLET
ncbi:hypothetical protein K1719_021651 [Acacia pycnantha]|nr:hypothetical protein K1719_021651 [Acacia pycnantha]